MYMWPRHSTNLCTSTHVSISGNMSYRLTPPLYVYCIAERNTLDLTLPLPPHAAAAISSDISAIHIFRPNSFHILMDICTYNVTSQSKKVLGMLAFIMSYLSLLFVASGYHDTAAYPMPSFINPNPWQPVTIPKPQPQKKRSKSAKRWNPDKYF